MAIVDAASSCPPTLSLFWTPCVAQSRPEQLPGKQKHDRGRISPPELCSGGFTGAGSAYLAFADDQAYMTLKFLIG
jgi:hypothetical protein